MGLQVLCNVHRTAADWQWSFAGYHRGYDAVQGIEPNPDEVLGYMFAPYTPIRFL